VIGRCDDHGSAVPVRENRGIVGAKIAGSGGRTHIDGVVDRLGVAREWSITTLEST
jgi:hypothetical protein